MKILKSSEMRKLDEKTIKDISIPSLTLMENAARGVISVMLKEGLVDRNKKVLIVAGKGNNGGDGLAIARNLHLMGIHVRYFLVYGKVSSKDASLQLDVLQKLGVKEEKDIGSIKDYDVVIDAIYGTGFKPPPDERASEVIRAINGLAKKVVAVDVPSGLSSDSGEIFEPSVSAHLTVTFQFPKFCHCLYPALKKCGDVAVVDISIPSHLAEDIERELILPESLDTPKREADVYKNRMGHVLILGGSEGKTGAVIMGAKASTETGSGLVTVGIPEDLNPIIESNLIEEMSLPLPEGKFLSSSALDVIEEFEKKFSAIAVGMGMDVYEDGYELIKGLLRFEGKPILLDADALNNIYRYGSPDILAEREGVTVITPHVGEMARLTGLPSDYIVNNLIGVASEFSVKWRCYIVLKSATTVVATPSGKVYVSNWGTPAMAKGGSGDVLSGILISLLGRGMDTEEALKLGVTLHGFAGRCAESLKHTETLRATDIIKCISHAYKRLEEISALMCDRYTFDYPLIFMQSRYSC